MSLGGFGRDFKKAPTIKIKKEDNSELHENLQKQLKLLRIQTNQSVAEIKELKNYVESTSIDTQDSFIKSLDGLKQGIDNLQKKQISLSLASSRALAEVANVLDSKFEELKETQVEVDYDVIKQHFINMETTITLYRTNMQMLVAQLQTKNPWIPVLIGCAIGLSGVLGYVVCLI
jgi:ElaB/YqjD/DUF883 family membrane-anchored ribosome-binding protein